MWPNGQILCCCAADLTHCTPHQVCATKKVCRYHPPEVTQGMAALARAQEQLQAACAAAWSQALRGFTAAHHAAFRAAVDAVAQLDALHSLALVASSPGYCRPQVQRPGQTCVCALTAGTMAWHARTPCTAHYILAGPARLCRAGT